MSPPRLTNGKVREWYLREVEACRGTSTAGPGKARRAHLAARALMAETFAVEALRKRVLAK